MSAPNKSSGITADRDAGRGEVTQQLALELGRWLADATSDSPTDRARTVGLCCYVNDEVVAELTGLLRHQFGCGIIPFEAGGKYWRLAQEGTQHRNSLRLDWVRKTILAARAKSADAECPSCHGLNISCPDGCGRDPITGELNGTRLERPADAEGGA